MRILGVDPGSLVTGYGVIDADGRHLRRVTSGVILLQPGAALPERLGRIYDGLMAVMEEHRPECFCIETAFYGKNVQSTLKLGQVRGVAILAAMHHHLPVTEYAPREVKRVVTGTGAAAKQQVAFMVQTLLALTGGFRRSDEADGLALALCHALHAQPAQASHGKKKAGSWAAFVQQHPERVRR